MKGNGSTLVCRLMVIATCVSVTSAALLAQEKVQPPASTAPSPASQIQERHQIYVMEGVLERAVEIGASMLNRRINAVMPNMMTLTGNARARGFRLDGYGVFFDVEVPGVRKSVAWSLRVLDQNDVGARSALRSVRRYVQTLADAQAKRDLEEAVRRLEQVVALAGNDPSMAIAGPDGSGAQVSGATLEASTQALPDPNDTYTTEVKNALINAMLDHSTSIVIGNDEWVTIAARDNAGPLPGEPYDVTTVVLRVKGSDLSAFRAGRLTRDEARAKVEVREF
ncbi:MAG: hypothetical protein HYS05_05910 [Acidobacteria bacterium]|nr:hypothetical protein [Acidobacteriota bacterium]